MKIVITESQYRVLFNRPNEVIFGGINEGRKPLTIDDFKANVPKEHRNDDGSLKYIYPDKFDGMMSKIILNCPKKGHGPFEIKRAITHLKQGQGCPECKKEERAAEFRKEATSMKIHQNDDGSPKYIYPDKLDGMDKPITIICSKKGHPPFRISKAKNHIYNAHGCPECNREKRETEFIKKAQQIHQYGGEPIYTYDNVKYVNDETRVYITCPIHGDFPQRPNNHLRGRGCPKCKESKGETIIKDYLTLKEYNPVPQMTFSSCTNEHRGIQICREYKFDVYVPEINTIIEYDGEQHFKDVSAWDKDCDLNCRIIKDKYKNEYCKDNGIKMIRISYNEKDIIGQLKKGLKSNEMFWISDNYPKEGWNK